MKRTNKLKIYSSDEEELIEKRHIGSFPVLQGPDVPDVPAAPGTHAAPLTISSQGEDDEDALPAEIEKLIAEQVKEPAPETKKPSKDNKTRAWFCTLNNPKIRLGDVYEAYKNDVQHLVGQMEAGESGTMHL